MNQPEIDRVERLNQYLDDLSRGMNSAQGAVDLEFTPSYQRLQQLDQIPGPTPAFAARLQQQLARQANASVQISRRRIPRQWIRRVDMASAAALAAAVLVITIVYSVNQPENEGINRVAITNDPTATTMSSFGFSATPTVQSQATVSLEPSPTGQAVAIVSPEPSPTDEAVTDISPEPSPTLPAQETEAPEFEPPVQAADIPFYDSLEQVLNASDVVVVGQPTGKITEIDANEIYSEFRVDQTLRGSVESEMILLLQLSELDPNQTYVLLLSPSGWGVNEAYVKNMTISPVEIEDGLIMPPARESPEYSIAKEYANQPLETLAADIAAVPEIQPIIRDLVVEYGWEPIGKGYLRPVDVPEREAFAGTKPLRFSDETWEMALAASQRIGLDFSQYAGQQLQILPCILERPQTDGERGIRAMILISEQQIVGAWVVVALEPQPFGLDQREEVRQIPVAVPTPEPTPTWPVPSGDTVNSAELYNLAAAPFLNFCWPYCDETMQPDDVRDEIVRALDVELAFEDSGVYPTPTREESRGQASGDIVVILFWHDAPFQSRATAFTFDRQTGMIQLPFEGGWIAAPPELAPLFAAVDIPPPPTKPG